MNVNNVLKFPKNKIKRKYRTIIFFLLGEISIATFIYLMGGVKYALAHLMYIPILYAAKEFKVYGGLISGAVSGILLSFYMPYDVVSNTMQPTISWIVRLLAFMIIGGGSGYFFHIKKRSELINELILSRISDSICVVDKYGIVTYANKKFYKYLNLLDEFKDIEDSDITGININDFDAYTETQDTIRFIKKISRAVVDGVALKDYYFEANYENNKILIHHKVEPIIYEHEYIGAVITIKDFMKKSDYEKNLKILRTTDSLTGLKNRSYFEAYASSQNSELLPQGYVVVDIDSLKFVNDSFGHLKGDELILKVSYILSKSLGNIGLVARLDGDEFIAVIPNTTTALVDALISRIQTQIQEYKINDIQMSVSCGYYIRKDTSVSVDESINKAEASMYLEKNLRNNPLKNNAVNVILSTLHEKDAYSEEHSTSVSKIAKSLSIAYDLPRSEVTEISNAALFHDIGKIIVPNSIINKTSRLTDDEYTQMKQHPEIGYRLLSTMNGMGKMATIVLSHHEHWNGKGYPKGIKKSEIPLGSRIIAVADSFDAMTSDRPYREKRSKEIALAELQRCSGTQFDPDIVKVFTKHFETIINYSD